ncbi:class II fructose-bisphosphate aldolase [Alicyclobacillus sp. SO9]|uniref:class II fructose-bisphosphate aldolase n=1 Tax=Alicyclobacillus sp. SO9 TaxID=2665646 RepID=UPI0018E801D9|nr:class II fructose-bisphosphate aldolase [Alicyclobacillus sp. SO9]QQE80482.1 class II fructose-bisphosphate aldolase [Alicyclobacillus sp. SO9]
MTLATGFILQDAYKAGYAVPAFSVHSTDMVDAVLDEAEVEKMPVLLQIGQRAIRNGQMETLTNHIRLVASQYKIPIAIHLDHCRDTSQAVKALRSGMTSFMMDASAQTFSDNVRLTGEVVQMCHAINMPVEGELGAIGGVEDDISVDDKDVVYTSVEAAVEFIESTAVDSLAVAIGSAHGMYKREPKLDLVRLEDIYHNTSVPLVLHGGSGISQTQIRKAIKFGIAKINFDTELRLAYVKGLGSAVGKFPDDPFSLGEHAKQALRTVVKEKIDYCRP